VLFNDMAAMHAAAFPAHTDQVPMVSNPGNFHLRNDGEAHLNTPKVCFILLLFCVHSLIHCHLNTPKVRFARCVLVVSLIHSFILCFIHSSIHCHLTLQAMVALQTATKSNSREVFKEYTREVDHQNKSVTLRGVMKLKNDKSMAIPLAEVEAAKDIVKRFNTGAMSLGSISQETHETLAVAMNSVRPFAVCLLSVSCLCPVSFAVSFPVSFAVCSYLFPVLLLLLFNYHIKQLMK
jgi:glutamate synthase domain-containing protein 2